MDVNSNVTMTVADAEAFLSERQIAIGTTVEEVTEAMERLGFEVEVPEEPPMGHQIVRVRPPAEYQGETLTGDGSVAVDITRVPSSEPDLVNTVDSQWGSRDALVRAFAQALKHVEAQAGGANESPH